VLFFLLSNVVVVVVVAAACCDGNGDGVNGAFYIERKKDCE
jgi:hypothetical protein